MSPELNLYFVRKLVPCSVSHITPSFMITSVVYESDIFLHVTSKVLVMFFTSPLSSIILYLTIFCIAISVIQIESSCKNRPAGVVPLPRSNDDILYPSFPIFSMTPSASPLNVVNHIFPLLDEIGRAHV